MLERVRHRFAGEEGFALVGAFVLILIVVALAALAVPSILGLRSGSADNATKANLRSAMPAADAYFADHKTYVGLDSTDLISIDPRVSLTVAVTSAKRRSYCLTESVEGSTWSVRGPNPTLMADASATNGWFEGDHCR